MIGTILGGLAIFGVSEIAGEVYHSWHYDDKKNPVMYVTRKLADSTEVVSEKVDSIKRSTKASTQFKKATSNKKLNTESASNISDALDNVIDDINKNKATEVNTKLSEACISLSNLAEMTSADENFKKLNEVDKKYIIDSKTKLLDLSMKIKAGEFTEAKAKQQVKSIGLKIGAIGDKLIAMNEEKEQKEAAAKKTLGAFTVSEDEKLIKPNFTKKLQPIVDSDTAKVAEETKKTTKKK